MLEILSTLFTVWCIYVIWKWLFPGKDGRARRRELKRQQKLGMIFPSEYPRNDSFELKQGIDYVMGGMLQWKKTKGGQLLIYKPAAKKVSASVTYWRREGEVDAGGRLPLRVHIQDIGALVVNVPFSGVIEARRENGALSSGDEILFLNTTPEAIQAWRDEQTRQAEQEREERRTRYLQYVEEEKRNKEALEELKKFDCDTDKAEPAPEVPPTILGASAAAFFASHPEAAKDEPVCLGMG